MFWLNSTNANNSNSSKKPLLYFAILTGLMLTTFSILITLKLLIPGNLISLTIVYFLISFFIFNLIFKGLFGNNIQMLAWRLEDKIKSIEFLILLIFLIYILYCNLLSIHMILSRINWLSFEHYLYLNMNIDDFTLDISNNNNSDSILLADNKANTNPNKGSYSNNGASSSNPYNNGASTSNNNNNPVPNNSNPQNQMNNDLRFRDNAINLKNPHFNVNMHQDFMSHIPAALGVASGMHAARIAHNVPGTGPKMLVLAGGGFIGGALTQSASMIMRSNSGSNGSSNNGSSSTNNLPIDNNINNSKGKAVDRDKYYNVEELDNDLLINDDVSNNFPLNLEESITDLLNYNLFSNISNWINTRLPLFNDLLLNSSANLNNETTSSSVINSSFSNNASTNLLNNSLNNESANKVTDVVNFDHISNGNISLNDYPWALLPEIAILNHAQLLLIIVMFNSFVVNKLITSNIDINSYLPNNKLGKILNILITRYINIWKSSYKFLFVTSFILITIANIGIKVFLYYILICF